MNLAKSCQLFWTHVFIYSLMSKAVENVVRNLRHVLKHDNSVGRAMASRPLPRPMRLQNVFLKTNHPLTQQIALSNVFGSYFQRKSKEDIWRNERRRRRMEGFALDTIPKKMNWGDAFLLNELVNNIGRSDAVLVFEPMVIEYKNFIKMKMESLSDENTQVLDAYGEDLMACFWLFNNRGRRHGMEDKKENNNAGIEKRKNDVTVFDYWKTPSAKTSSISGLLNAKADYIMCLLNHPSDADIRNLVFEEEARLRGALLSSAFLGGASGISRAVTLMKEPWKMQDNESDLVKSSTEILKALASFGLVKSEIVGDDLYLKGVNENGE